MADLLELSTTDPSLWPAGARVLAVRGHEALSEAFHYEVLVRMSRDDADALDPGALVGQPATLRVREADDVAADVHGIVWSFELLHGDAVVYAVVALSPRARRLQLARTSRVFCDTTLGAIVKEVAGEAGLEGTAAYSPDPALDEVSEEHVAQYEETSWDFVSRWLERLGTTFFFDHEGDEETWVLLSDPSKHPKSQLGRLRYDPKASSDASAGRAAFDVRFARTTRVGKVRLADGDYDNPSLEVEGEEPADDLGVGEWVQHGSRFFTPDAGAALAKVIAEAELARRQTIELAARGAPLHAGFLFELEGHPDADRNGPLVATAVDVVAWNAAWSTELERLFPLARAPRGDARDEGRAGAGWSGPGAMDRGLVTFVRALPKGTAFRPRLSTPWPRIRGVETAVIDGEDAPYADLDDRGRYQIAFHFDARRTEPGRHSTRLRMAQPHAGNPEGWHLPLRPTTEVLVAFEDGDPDRPVIVGAVPDGAHPSVVTSANHTKNVFHTGSDNRLEIEDQAGKEWLHWLTPTETTYVHLGAHEGADQHNIVKHTLADLLFRIGGNQDVLVGGELREWVAGAVDEDYNTSQTTLVQGPQTTDATGAVTEDYDALQMTVVGGDVTETYGTGQTSTVTGVKLEVYASGQTTDVTGDVSETYTGAHVKTVTADVTQTYSGGLTRTVTGPVLQTWASNVTLDWGATEAKYASLVWMIPVSRTWTVPRLDLFHLTWTQNSLKYDDIHATKTEPSASEAKVAQGKIDIQPFHLVNVIAKADAAGIAIKLQKGPAAELGSINLELAALYVKTAGATHNTV